MHTRKLMAVLAVVALAAAGCSNTGSSPSATTAASETAMASTSASASASAGAELTIDSFTADYSAMAQLKDMVSSGSGKVAVLLPDTTSSARYTQFDAPNLKSAFEAAGYSASDFSIQNAQGNTDTQLSMADAAITAGVKVLIMDPIDSTVGKQIQSKAAAAGVALISYDRATFQGDKTYYVSFNNVEVGKKIGEGFKQCVSDWGVSSPKIYQLDGGEDTDPNAIDFAKGYNSVIWGQEKTPLDAGTTNSDGWTLVNEEIAPGWDNAKGGTIFSQAYTAHPEINATVEANDGLAGAVIEVLKRAGVPAKKIPTTGQDATTQGMAYILQDYQCGSVYKPIYVEAQAAVALATYLRSGQAPPSGLLNGTTTDPTNASVTEPAVLLTPMWVDKTNMEDTVIKDGAVTVSDLCGLVGQSVCDANGIK